jgi:TatD DNase family protein
MHAHLNPKISAYELGELKSVIFAVTRSLSDSRQVVDRTDPDTVWGIGCHPAIGSSRREFEELEFMLLVERSAFVGEVGLDGSRSEIVYQMELLIRVLRILASAPRIVSLHSYAATTQVLEVLESTNAKGVVLHWWLGSDSETKRAVELGCYFSINESMINNGRFHPSIPSDRLLSETDHPFGNRTESQNGRPGGVGAVETAIAETYGLSSEHTRRLIWQNLSQLVENVGCYALLPLSIRARIASM